MLAQIVSGCCNDRSNVVKKTILTIDDEAIVLNHIMEILKDEYIVRPFTSGEAALKFLESHDADLILLDCNMSGMSGFEVLERLQADERMASIPVIFLTGLVDDDSEVVALASGAMDYIQKPIKAKPLALRVSLQIELQENRKKLERLIAERTEELNTVNKMLSERGKTTLNLLASASDMREHETDGHISRMTDYVRIIATDLVSCPKEGYEITAEQARNIIDATKFHDIGKVAMPDSILLKPEKLTAEEYEIIMTHPVQGIQLLEELVQKLGSEGLLDEVYNVAFAHHEKWDGTGYPRKLSGADIPLSARIVKIVDVFDVLTNDRPYDKAASGEFALEVLRNGAGSQFDPYLIEVVMKHEDVFKNVNAGGIKAI